MSRYRDLFNPLRRAAPGRHARLLCLFATVCLLAGPAAARDLNAVSDGEHLWVVDPGEPGQVGDSDETFARMQVYHASASSQSGGSGTIVKLEEPIAGELMPRGLAAGDDLLLMVTEDRELITLSPHWSPLMDRWMYSEQSLLPLPEGCVLLGVSISERGPWALVRIESAQLLEQLDRAEDANDEQLNRERLNRVLGLPDNYDYQPEAGGDESPEPDAQVQGQAEAEAETDEQAAAPELPAYRLIHIYRGRWKSSPLPVGFVEPRFAALLMRHAEERPTLVVEPKDPALSSGELVLYRPQVSAEALAPDEDEAAATDNAAASREPTPEDLHPWQQTRIDPRPYPGKLWSAALVEGQVVFVVELSRNDGSVVVELYHLRSAPDNASGLIGQIELQTGDSPQWAAVPWRDALGLVAAPAPTAADDNDDATGPAFAVLSAMTLRGDTVAIADPEDPEADALTLYTVEQGEVTGSADQFIQIGTFVIAMVMMMMYYRRAIQTQQLDLPDGVVLAGFGRRLFAGAIDLAPGFWLAGTMYELSIRETLLFWPGNGVPKAVSAMAPGFIVIVVTLAHTAVGEVLFARSLGKLVAGLAVADVHGRRAKPGNVLLRSLSRVFELFAPLMLILALISPARQRLGDMLAGTIVVMRRPEPKNDKQDDDQP